MVHPGNLRYPGTRTLWRPGLALQRIGQIIEIRRKSEKILFCPRNLLNFANVFSFEYFILFFNILIFYEQQNVFKWVLFSISETRFIIEQNCVPPNRFFFCPSWSRTWSLVLQRRFATKKKNIKKISFGCIVKLQVFLCPCILLEKKNVIL